MPTPERFELPRAQRVAVAVIAGVMLTVSAIAAWFAWHGISGSRDPHGDLVGLSTLATLMGIIGVGIAVAARQAWHSAITLRDGGIELERGEEMPAFISWGQIGGVKLRSASGGTAVLGMGGEKLFAIDSRLTGVGRLLTAVLVNGVFPKRPAILPFQVKQSTPPLVPIAMAFVAGIAVFAFVGNAPAEARTAVLTSFGVIALIVAGITLLVARFGSGGTITVDADGITYGRAGTRRPWSDVQGAALAFVRGPKGQRFPRVALQGLDGRWEPLPLQWGDLVGLLAAINAAAPGKVIAPPDEPLGLADRLNFRLQKRVTFRIGKPPAGNDPS